MKRANKQSKEIVYTFTKEKLDEVKDMSTKQKLKWLEEANLFINKTIGFKKRALSDARFKHLAEINK